MKTEITARCPIRTTLELVGGKWKLLIIYQLGLKNQRLSELKRNIPDVSEKMLIQELKRLAESELVIRINYGEVPPKVEYQLTNIGKEVMPLITQMRNYGLKYMDQLT
jgi:DNA-binding HxlR family transcriptional regulator